MPTSISDERSVFTLINRFDTANGQSAAVVTSLRDFTESFARYQPGFIAAAVHVATNHRQVLNYVQWTSTATFEAMSTSPEFRAHSDEVRLLADAISPTVCSVVYVGLPVTEVSPVNDGS